MTTLIERAVKAIGPQRLAEAFTPAEWELLRYHWPSWAREKQLPPPGDWRVWYLKAGRGFGKTRTGAEWIRSRQEQGFMHFALLGQSPADVRDVMVEGESGLIAISPPQNRPLYEPSKRRLTWPNGARAICYSGANPDELRGPQHDTVWVDELASFDYAQETWDNLLMGLRLGRDPRVLITSTPKPKSILRSIQADTQTIMVTGNSYENRANLPPQFFDAIINRYEGTRTGQQEIYAQDMDEAEGALWTRNMIEKSRVQEVPDLVRVVIGVDPPGGATECGVVVAGRAENDHVYILADLSIRSSPEGWAQRVVDAYEEYKADRILGEQNYGGDMVEATIKAVAKAQDKTVSYSRVQATRGKAVRAEPVVARYEKTEVHHTRAFTALEDEMCSWVPGDSAHSPNRMDALVWAVTALTRGGTPNVRWI